MSLLDNVILRRGRKNDDGLILTYGAWYKLNLMPLFFNSEPKIMPLAKASV